MLNFVSLNFSKKNCQYAELIDSEGMSYPPFYEVREHLKIKGYSLNTISTYLGHISRFLDYVITASSTQHASNAKTLQEIIYSYESFLLYGVDSKDIIASSVCSKLNKTSTTSPASLASIESAILILMQLSDVAAEELDQPGLFGNLFPNTLTHIKDSEKYRIRIGTMLGGIIRGGAKTKRSKNSIFRTPRRAIAGSTNKDNFAFPIEKGIELINKAKSFRDKSYYALLLASGARSFEAAQIQIDDVDANNERVEIVNPFTRDIIGITEDEFNALDWKGRAISETFLIEPFSSLFFKFLRLYLRSNEYDDTTEHQFLFQKIKGEGKGRPFFTNDRSSVIKQFKATCKSINVILPKGVAIHSLRHSYAVFILNYLPTPKGYGLPLSYVSHLMGHSSIESTKVYAKHEDEIIRSELEFANRLLIGEENPLSQKQILIEYYISKIKSLENAEIPTQDITEL